MRRQPQTLVGLVLGFLAVVPFSAMAVGESTSIQGTVLGPGGVELVGASVSVYRSPANYEVLRELLGDAPPGAPVAVAKTGVGGRFATAVPAIGVWQLVVEAAGFVPMRYALLPAVSAVELPTLTLRPARVTPVEVVNRAGVGLAGIAVRAASANHGIWKDPPSVGWRPAPRRGRSDNQGRLSLWRGQGERLDIFAYPPHGLGVARAKAVRRSRLLLTPALSRRSLEVVEADGSPAAGVIVALAAGQWPLGLTDTQGQLVLAGEGESSQELLLLTSDGRMVKVRLEPASAAAKAVFQLPPTASVRGRVVTADGRPLAGVLVWPGQDPGRFVVTDSAGGYAVNRMDAQRLRLQAHGRGRPPQLAILEAGARSLTAPDLVLKPGGRLTGRVVDALGAALPGARIAVLARGRERTILGLDRALARAVTRSDGRFSLSALPATVELSLRVAAPGTNPRALVLAPLSGGADGEELVIALRSGRIALGRVLDTEERPVVGAEVRLLPTAGEAREGEAEAGWRALSGENGQFEVAEVEEGLVNLVVRAPGYAPARVRGLRIPPGAGAFELGTVILEPGVSVRGRVVDVVGKGVGEAAVWVSEQAATAGSTWVVTEPESDADAVAGADGRFTLDSLVAGVTISLIVDAPGFLPLRLGQLSPPLEGPLEVTLQPASQLVGWVSSADGVAVSGARISLHAVAAEGDPVAAFRGALAALPPQSVLSGEDGRFLLADLGEGRYEVEAFAQGFQPPPVQSVKVALPTDPVPLRFVLEPGASLTGLVLDSKLEPVAGARVRVGRPEGRSDERGLYRVEGITPGSVSVVVEHPGFDRLLRDLDIAEGVTEAEFVLEGGYAVGGFVVDGSDLPVGGATVELEPLDSDASVPYRVSADEAGLFRFDRVAQGGYQLRGRRGGYAESEPRTRIEVAGEGVEEVEVRLQLGARIEGEITGLDFEELARVEVVAEAPERSQRVGEVDYEGHFVVADLEPDDWTVRALLDGGQRQARARVTVVPGDRTVSRDLEFGRGITLLGLVLHAGEAVASAQLELRGQGIPLRRSTTTDPEGRFRLEDLQPGDYHLGVAHHGRGLLHNETLALADDREVLIEIETAGIVGTVVDKSTGEPLERALIGLLQQLDNGGEGSKISIASEGGGQFRYDSLPGGRFRLTAQRDGYQPTERTIHAAAGTTASVQIELEPASGLEVIASLPSGTTPRYITVWGRDGAGRQFAETRGGFAQGTPFSTLPAGEWNLLIGGTGGALVETRVTVPSEPLQVVLPTAGRLRVRVPALVESDTSAVLTLVAEGGQPFRHLAWGGALEQSWQLAGGRAIVEGVPAGLWTLRVQASDGRTWSATAASTGGPDIEVNLE